MNKIQKRLLPISLCLTVAASMGACIVLADSHADTAKRGLLSRGTYSETITKSVPLSESGKLTLANRNGNIKIATWEKPEVWFEAEKKMKIGGGASARLFGIFPLGRRPFRTDEEVRDYFGKLKVDVSGNEEHIRVSTIRPEENVDNVSLSISYDMKIPKTASLQVNTRNGTVTLSGVKGGSKVETRNGSIACTDLDGPNYMSTRNGNIICDKLCGPVNARTRNGSVKIAFSEAPEEAEKVLCESRNGAIRVAFPGECSFDLDARTRNGRISTDFVVKTTGVLSKDHLSGHVGDGGTTVALVTRNGSISLHKIPYSNARES